MDRLISADSHVVEPPDLWETRIDRKYRDRAPRIVREGDIHRWYVDDAIAIGSLGAPSQAGRRYDAPSTLSVEAPFEAIPSAAYDPDERLAAMEVDGVVAELVFPTIGARLYTVAVGGEFLSACFRTLNDWLAEFCGSHPDRLKGVALLNVDDPADAATELERCARMGLAAGSIPAFPEGESTYDLAEYDRLWAAAQDLGLPLAMHSGSTRQGPGRMGVFAADASARGTSSFRATQDHWPRRSVADMLFGGVFERFPKLRMGVVEYELGWAPFFIRQMNLAYSEHRYVKEIRFSGDRLPSDVFHTNLFITFQEDFTGVANRHIIGVDNIMWGSDFPHTESTWPNSRAVLGKVLEGVPEDEQRSIVYGNAARIFGFN